MPIVLRLDRIMADRKMNLKELSENVGISYVNLSKIKTGKVQGVRFSTLEAICETLDCQPGDILEFVRDEDDVRHRKDQDRWTSREGASENGFAVSTNRIAVIANIATTYQDR